MSITSVSAVVCSFDFKSFFSVCLDLASPCFLRFVCILLFIYFFCNFLICLFRNLFVWFFLFVSFFVFMSACFYFFSSLDFIFVCLVIVFFVMFAHLYSCFTLPSTSGCQALVDPSVLKANLAIGRLEWIIDRKSLIDWICKAPLWRSD